MPRKPNRRELKGNELIESRLLWRTFNWRRKEEYSKFDTVSLTRLRWEFLRRTDEYREAWKNKETMGFTSFGLSEWKNPKESDNAPRFDTSCNILNFSETETLNQLLHYEALRSSRGAGDLIFSVNLYEPIGPQLDFIRNEHNKRYKLIVPPEDSRKRPKRKNNTDGRSPSYLLRILDAYNEGVKINDLALEFGGEDGISETAIRKTIKYAQEFWKKI